MTRQIDPTLWQDDFARQIARVQADFWPRILSATATILLSAIFVEPALVATLMLVYLASELIQIVLLRGPIIGRGSRRHFAFLGNSAMGASAYAATAVLLWQTPDPMVKLGALVYLIGGFVNGIAVHSLHLPMGLTNSAPMGVALLTLPIEGILTEGLTRQTGFALATVLILLVYFTFVLLDYHRIERQLAQAQRRADQASRAKSRFLASMSHEMITPLNSILGTAEMLKHGRDPAKVALLERAGHTLQAMIDDALDLAERDAADEGAPLPPLVPRTGPLARDIAITHERQQVLAAARGIDLVLSGEHAVPELAVYDRLRLRQCLGGLIAQCVADAAPGRLRVAAETAERGPALILTVTLTGSPDLTPKPPACGYASAEAIASQMDGQLHLAPTAARLTLRLGRVTAAAVPEPPAQPCRVLIVDDISTNRFIVSHLLRGEGFEPVEVESGQAALAALQAQRFDLVLLDMNMPDMTGAATFDAIRTAAAPWSGLPVIALTADALPSQRAAYLALGLSGYIAKPVDRALLLAEIGRVMALPA